MWWKKLVKRKIIVLALAATGLGAYFSPEAIELLLVVSQALAESE